MMDLDSELSQECEECGKYLSPMQAEDSYAITHDWKTSGMELCAKHLDQWKRYDL